MEEIKNKTNLASNQENGKKEHGVFALVAAAVVLLFFGSFLWISIQKPNHNINSEPQPSADRNSCQQNSDCVLASKYYSNKYGQSSCCPMNCEQEAVNIMAKEKETKVRDEYCATKDYQCPKSEQCVKQSLEAVCEQDKCVMKEKAKEYEQPVIYF